MKGLDYIVLQVVFGEVNYKSLSLQQQKWALPILLFMAIRSNSIFKT